MPAIRSIIQFGAAFAALFVSVSVNSDALPSSPQSYFDDYGYCALILSRTRLDETSIEVGPKQCQQVLSPCSTFKIPNALIGLQTGVVSGPEDLKKWDGTQRKRSANNKDHTLQTAISDSIPWYFQELARDVGEQRMAQWLERLDYGNQDISSGIDRFWLGSSLKINAYEQMKLIRGLWHGTLPFDPGYQQQVSDMLILDSGLDGTLHGKTGSCLGANNQDPPDHGWFVGWVDWNKTSARDTSTTFFVINISGTRAWGWEAKKIALQILQDLHPGYTPESNTEN